MFGSHILDAAVGIVFVYVLVSVTCSAVREGIEAWLKTRAAYLEYGIRELLHDKAGDGLASDLYKHPLIYGLFPGAYNPGKFTKRPRLLARGANLPSYIPAKNFALALLDMAARGPKTDAVRSNPRVPFASFNSVRTNVGNLRNEAVQRVVLTAMDSAQGDLPKTQAIIEEWYNSATDRISGWYKRSTQWIIFWIALAFAVGLNVNTITIFDYLYRNDAARAVVVARAQAGSADQDFLNQSYAEATQNLDSLRLPIGWAEGWGVPK